MFSAVPDGVAAAPAALALVDPLPAADATLLADPALPVAIGELDADAGADGVVPLSLAVMAPEMRFRIAL
ncbi:Hypothetical protein PFCIRM134_08365 [Propionibacterium freudenreichii]|uniref:Uncharacterized protein n=1 Tax=Propionibacterium freudenreichii subsp. shermanii (strain ATCC 9614 / DSM 4902 / CIP 103027 / NCIMB 8099 / CIRM-BIA1) TaxID=754252 RepID=D7GHU6_PROFC|nr:hypothetical protein [Propionibacterium sp.]CBL55668.1 Hypothetical protein PFREUD_01510 [Propionibacterium freudenreichii subsp. shermanii CIRM-BIA1]CEG86492.1 Hypothetical protein PFCIRM118_10825 [Propionibacterium freudenreichii]CEG91024.1 Hypothetical protein PFCIRM121_06895 [Propionibacterium freudenreichii]CEG94417.1 Hypothetical protein PFCIRM122_03175 [Propionibacterium freudenreichii]